MATITSTASGNFSAGATWVGGVVPTVGDIAVAATGHVVVIDVNTTVDKVTQAGTGKFTLGNGITLTAEVEANAGTFTSGGTVEVICGAGETAYIVGNVTGVSSTAVNVCGVNVTGVGTLELTGNVTGSAGNASSVANGHAGVYTNVTCTIDIQGNITAGPGNFKFGVFSGASSNATTTITGNVTASSGTFSYGAHATGISSTTTITGNVTAGAGANAYGALAIGASATITITGDVTGGTGATAYGAHTTGASATITITGNVTGGTGTIAYGAHANGASGTITITGDVTAGAGTTAYGAYASGATSLITATGTATAVGASSNAIRSNATTAQYGVLFSGDLIDTQTGVSAAWTAFFRIIDTSPSGITQYANNSGYPTGGTVSRVSPDNVTGMAQELDVRDGTIYGYNGELEGRLAVPPAASVAAGVPVDATVGTAAVRLQDVADVTGAQIVAAITALP